MTARSVQEVLGAENHRAASRYHLSQFCIGYATARLKAKHWPGSGVPQQNAHCRLKVVFVPVALVWCFRSACCFLSDRMVLVGRP